MYPARRGIASLAPALWQQTVLGAPVTSTSGQALQPCARAFSSDAAPSESSSDTSAQPPTPAKQQWQALLKRLPQGTSINPCNSKLHPAVEAGVISAEELGEELSVQEAYTPQSVCFGCGPANPEGLRLRSTRTRDGLEATVTVSPKYCAFPGIVNGGIVSALLDCHGNWTAAMALMDKGCLPRPPLTLTASIHVSFREPTPPNTPLLLRSRIIAIKDYNTVGKASVEVETSVYRKEAASEPGMPDAHPAGYKLLAVGKGVHKRLGALRAL